MAAAWKLVQAFVRQATENADYTVVTDIATAYARLRAVQSGAFTMVTTENGLVQTLSKIGESQFNFAVPPGFGPGEVMEIAETALQLIEGRSVAQARALLVRRKHTRPDFRGLSL